MLGRLLSRLLPALLLWLPLVALPWLQLPLLLTRMHRHLPLQR